MFKYDPHQKNEHEIEETFVSGKKYLADILDDLKPDNGRLSNQCVLITGRRGMGKSHFLKQLFFSIKNNPLLSDCYFPVIFPEELFKVNSLHHLLKDALSRIFSEIKNAAIEYGDSISELKKEYESITNRRFKGNKKEQLKQRQESETAFFHLLRDSSAAVNRKFIFLLENLQDLFGKKLTTDELKRLRGFLQQDEDALLIMGTAVSVFHRVEKHGEPFYNFFRFRKLTGLSSQEVVELLKAESRVRGNPAIRRKVETYRGEIEVFRILTGGNPRLCLFLYDLLAEREEILTEDILKKLTDMTPYFKAETERLSGPKQLIIDALCDVAPAQTPSEISHYISEPIGIVNENLKRLMEDGLVEILDTRKGKKIKKSETFYRINDYFYRIWYQIRQSVSCDENVTWMAELAALLFRENELTEKLENCAAPLKPVYENAVSLAGDETYMARIRLMTREVMDRPDDGVEKTIEGLFKDEDWQGVLAEADLIIEENIRPESGYFLAGYAYHELGELGKAVESYKKVLEIKPDYHQAWSNMGNSYKDLGEYPEAVSAYKKALEIKPDYHEAWFNMGFCYADLGEYFEAISAYKKVVEIKPDDHEAWYSMGCSYGDLGEHSEAVSAYKKALEIKPDYYNAWFNMGLSYINLGEHPEALSAFIRAMEIKPDDHEAWFNMGNSYAGLGEHSEAVSAYKKELEIKPDDHKAWFNMGFCYAELEAYPEAVSAYLIFIRHTPVFPHLTLSAFRHFRRYLKETVDEKERIQTLADPSASQSEKLSAMGDLVCLGRLNGVEALVAALFEDLDKSSPEKLVQRELKKLYFFLMVESIWRLNQESEEPDPTIPARYFLKTAVLLDDHREIEEKVREFILNSIRSREDTKINKQGLKAVFEEWETMDTHVPEFVPALVEAIGNPDSRAAQVWSADPLFKEIVSQLTRSLEKAQVE